MYPTLVELANLSPLNPRIKGEPPLEGTSMVPLLGASPREEGNFTLAFSQYSRKRCPSDLYSNGPCQKGETPATYTGFSVRSFEYRYTRWVHVATDGTPQWESPVSEEFYDERPGNTGV